MKITNRHGHIGPGLCSLTYSSPTNGQKVITCGADNLIKIHDLEREKDEDGVVGESDHFQEGVHAVAASPDGQYIAAGGAGKTVALFKLPDLEFEKNVTRCSLEIRDICFSPSGDFIAVASDDPVLRIVNVQNMEECKTLEGHAGAVKAIAFDPKGSYLASSGADCTVRIWDVTTYTEKTKFTKMYSKDAASGMADGIPKNMCRVAWCGLPQFTQNPGRFVAVAGSKEVRVFERDTWKELEAFPSYGQEISIVEFSPNGLYLLTVDVEGEIVVWNVEERHSIVRKMNSEKVLAAHWDFFMNTITVIAEDGSWGTWNNVVPDKYVGPAQADLATDDAVLSDDGEDFDLDELEKLEAADPKESNKIASSGRIASRPMPVHFSVERQEPFQPQSTKLEHKRRFLAFTSDGSITMRSEIAFNAIEIEFADVTQNRPIRFNDYSFFTMAAMGKIAAFFASSGNSSHEGGASVVHYRPFESWANNSDWTHTLPVGETATAVAICDKFAAATTSMRFLRIFSFSGLEKFVYSLPGPAVCLHGLGDFLGCVYHLPSSPSVSGDQELEFQLLDLKEHRLVCRDRLCLSAGATLEWFQVVRSGLVAAMDSEGIVMVYTPAEMGGQWCPVLDVKVWNKPRDWFWPIALDEKSLTGVVCKIEKRYPDVVQPVITQFALSAPLIRREVDPQEESWYRTRLFLTHDEQYGPDANVDEEEMEDRARALDTTLCRLFDAACKAGKQNRALDLVMNMKSKAAMDIAHKLAVMSRLNTLAEKIDLLRQVRFAEEEEMECSDEPEQSWMHTHRQVQQARPQKTAREGSNVDSGPVLKRSKVQFDDDSAEAACDSGIDDPEEEDEEPKANITTPPAVPSSSRRVQSENKSDILFMKKSSNQDAPRGTSSTLDKINAMKQKPAEPISRPKVGAFGSAGFGRPPIAAKQSKKR